MQAARTRSALSQSFRQHPGVGFRPWPSTPSASASHGSTPTSVDGSTSPPSSAGRRQPRPASTAGSGCFTRVAGTTHGAGSRPTTSVSSSSRTRSTYGSGSSPSGGPRSRPRVGGHPRRRGGIQRRLDDRPRRRRRPALGDRRADARPARLLTSIKAPDTLGAAEDETGDWDPNTAWQPVVADQVPDASVAYAEARATCPVARVDGVLGGFCRASARPRPRRRDGARHGDVQQRRAVLQDEAPAARVRPARAPRLPPHAQPVLLTRAPRRARGAASAIRRHEMLDPLRRSRERRLRRRLQPSVPADLGPLCLLLSRSSPTTTGGRSTTGPSAGSTRSGDRPRREARNGSPWARSCAPG